MTDLFALTMPLWEILLRGVVVYGVLVMLVRFVPKRKAGHLSPNDMLTLIVIGGMANDAILGGTSSVGDILLMIGVFVGLGYALDALEYYVPAVGRLMRDRQTPLIERGELIRRNMRHEMVTEAELMAALRESGVDDIGAVRSACLEADGNISVIVEPTRGR